MQQALRKRARSEPDPVVTAPASVREEVERRMPPEDYSKSPCEGAIDWVTINGFKSIRELHELPLGRVNVLVGANGSGKSNFLKAVLFLRHIAEGDLRFNTMRSGGNSRLLYSGQSKAGRIELGVSFSERSERYQVCLAPGEEGALLPTEEAVFLRQKSGKTDDRVDLKPNGVEAGISARSVPGEHTKSIAQLRDRMRSWRVHHFHDTSFGSPMRQDHDIHQTLDLMGDGGNLAAYLLWLQQHHEFNYSRILSIVRALSPFIEDSVLKPVLDGNPQTVRLRWKHAVSRDILDVDQVSDGTLRLIALTTLLRQPVEHKPSTILINEPELGLDLDAIAVIGGLIRSASHSCQIIVATQNQYLLDYFEPHEVLVANLVDGETRINRLDPKRVEYLLDEYSLGQLWAMNHFAG